MKKELLHNYVHKVRPEEGTLCWIFRSEEIKNNYNNFKLGTKTKDVVLIDCLKRSFRDNSEKHFIVRQYEDWYYVLYFPEVYIARRCRHKMYEFLKNSSGTSISSVLQKAREIFPYLKNTMGFNIDEIAEIFGKEWFYDNFSIQDRKLYFK